MTLEDETGNANVIIMPDFYEKNRQAVLEPRFVRTRNGTKSGWHRASAG